MFDIVATEQNKATLVVEVEDLNDTKPGRAATGDGAAQPATGHQPENVGQQQQQDENRHKSDGVLDVGRHIVSKQFSHRRPSGPLTFDCLRLARFCRCRAIYGE
ncbi:MAG: hypothetical protein ACRCUX_04705 [Beijerinckiaceae bacterium]